MTDADCYGARTMKVSEATRDVVDATYMELGADPATEKVHVIVPKQDPLFFTEVCNLPEFQVWVLPRGGW